MGTFTRTADQFVIKSLIVAFVWWLFAIAIAKSSRPVLAFLRSAGVPVVQTLVRAPNCNAHAERFVRSIKLECLHRVIPLGERHLRRVREYVAHRIFAIVVLLSSRPLGRYPQIDFQSRDDKLEAHWCAPRKILELLETVVLQRVSTIPYPIHRINWLVDWNQTQVSTNLPMRASGYS